MLPGVFDAFQVPFVVSLECLHFEPLGDRRHTFTFNDPSTKDGLIWIHQIDQTPQKDILGFLLMLLGHLNSLSSWANSLPKLLFEHLMKWNI